MHARHFAMFVALAAASGAAAAHLVGPAAEFTPLAGFIKAGMFVARDPQAPSAASVPAERPSCAGATFSELGHGHPDVADAGFAVAHCPPRQDAAGVDAGLASPH